ncbi:diguanylate cyclase [Rhizobium wenxiniae]|nr:diguanylate cyclase [Rhizobium wenxiniae]
MTVWDEAIRRAAERDHDWLDANLGAWMHTYFGHDAAVVLGQDFRPLYQFIAEDGHPPRTDDLAQAYLPLAQRLQQRLAAGDTEGINDRNLSIGEADLVYVGFRPAVVSVKPIVSDTGNVEQVPGSEKLHVAVRFLDRDLPPSIGQEYQLASLEFDVQQPKEEGLSFVPLKARSGAVVGYFHWTPFRPGQDVLKATFPVLLIALTAFFGASSMAGGAIWRRSCRLASSQEALRHQANHDSLTGLANRSFFNEQLAARLAEANVDEQHCVLFVDLDRFKEVNDTFGHPTGDKIISMAALRMSELLPHSLIARIGGDEFTLLLDQTSAEQVDQIADDIVKCLRSPFEHDGFQIVIGASVGVAVAKGRCDPLELTRQADIALYHAKAAGKNTYAIFGSHMAELLRRRSALEHDLRAAIKNREQIEVFYQPVYAAVGAELCALEALVRWNHPTFGYISPQEFIPIAEETGLIHEIGTTVLDDSCSVLFELPHITVSINASALEMQSPAYPLRILTALSEWQVKPERLEIELTESVAAGDSVQLELNIKMLRSAGVKIAIDDFGTGYSSFSRVQKFAVDRLKIDKSFVDDLDRGDSNATIAAIITMAQRKGLKVTAEGVETAEQQELLRDLGCDHLQGFLLSRPLTRGDMMALLKVRAGATA